jgi:solute carrier family 35 (UDP-galactose transporter), member B1
MRLNLDSHFYFGEISAFEKIESKFSGMGGGGAADLVWCVAGIYGCFLSWAFLQERLSSRNYSQSSSSTSSQSDGAKDGQSGHFEYFIVLNCVQAATCALWAVIYAQLGNFSFGRKTIANPGNNNAGNDRGLDLRNSVNGPLLREYFSIALSASVASPFGYASLRHISYPVHMLAKSSKLIPVMAVGKLLHRRTYPLYKYVSVALVSSGVSGFMLQLAEKKVHNRVHSSSWYGIALVFINMLLDGYTGATQDQLLKKKHCTPQQMMFWMNACTVVLLAAWLVAGTLVQGTGLGFESWRAPEVSELSAFVSFARAFPDVLVDMALFCVGGALGQTFVFKTLGLFGSITLVTITVTRKLCTIVLSVVLYHHSVSSGQWVAVGVVFAGIVLEAWISSQAKTPTKSD